MQKLLIALACTAGIATAQCGTLSTDGTGAAGTDLTISLAGATADSFAVLFLAETTGSSTIELGPMLSLNLGLAEPVIPVPLGGTDENGDVSVTFTVPSMATTAWTVEAQAGTFTFSFMPFSIGACESNVTSVTVGG